MGEKHYWEIKPKSERVNWNIIISFDALVSFKHTILVVLFRSLRMKIC
jgi:hypothetical protein